MMIPFAALAIGAQLLVAVADGVPKLDIGPSCRAAARSGLSARDGVDACLRGEQAARDQLAKQWAEFTAADKVRCVEMTKTGGPPSYVEVLTCLELARDAAQVRKESIGTPPKRR
jgi:hypothetical protein